MRGSEQQEGIHYIHKHISSPVTNDVIIQIVLVLMIMANWALYLCNMHGTLLIEEFEGEEELLVEVPRGFESKYARKTYLRLRKGIYGLRQEALMF